MKEIKSSTGLIIISAFAVVVFGGAYTWANLNAPADYSVLDTTINVSKAVSKKTVEIPVVDETADWKTYTNDTYGFSFKYPKELSYEEANGGKNIAFKTSKEKADYESCIKKGTSECIKSSQIIIAVDELVGVAGGDNISSSLDDILLERVKNDQIVKNPIKMILGQQPAYEGIATGMFSSYNIVSKYNNHIYDLRINCNSAVKDITNINSLKECKSVIGANQSKMISTFQFTTPSATADWQTYKNDTYGFSFKYPNDWRKTETNEGAVQLYSGPEAKSFPPSETKIVVYILDNSNQLSVDEFIKKSPDGTAKSSENIKVTNIDSVRYNMNVELGTKTTITYIPKDKKMIKIVTYENQEVLDSILSTFQFAK